MCCIAGWLVPDVSRECGDLIFKVQTAKELWFNFQQGQESFLFSKT